MGRLLNSAREMKSGLGVENVVGNGKAEDSESQGRPPVFENGRFRDRRRVVRDHLTCSRSLLLSEA